MMNQKNNSFKSIAITLSIIFVLFLVALFSPVGPTFNQITEPLQNAVYSAGQFVRERAVFARDIGDLLDENSRLESQVGELENELIELERLKEENTSLREQLSFTERRQLRFIGADVISYQTDGARQLLRIAAGSEEGITNEMAVVSRGHLIGLIDSVSQSESVVRLITDPSFRISAVIEESAAPGIIQGRLGGSTVMEKIPQFQVPEIGSTVITSGLGEKVPNDLRIGSVSAVSENADSVFAQAQIQTPFDPRTIETVLVIEE